MCKKVLKGGFALLLTFIMVFAGGIAARGMSDTQPEFLEDAVWIIHFESLDGLGNVAEQLSEFHNSLFYLRNTDDYIYSSQLTHLGYYSFAFGVPGSREASQGLVHIEELSERFSLQLPSDFVQGDTMQASIELSRAIWLRCNGKP